MATIKSIKNKGEFIKKQTGIGSVTNEVVGQQFVDVSEVLDREVAALSKLGVLKTYSSVSEMDKYKVSPVGDDGELILHGQLVAVLNTSSPNENGLYSYCINDGVKSWKKRSDVSIPTDSARKGGYEGTLKDLNEVKVDKIAGESLISDTEIIKLSKLPTKEQLDSFLGDKANKIFNEKNVVYAINGDITKDNSFLASNTQNGLISKEQNKFINDLINEYQMIEEYLKSDEEKYETTIIVQFENKEEVKDMKRILTFTKPTATSIMDLKVIPSIANSETLTKIIDSSLVGVQYVTSKINDSLVVRVNGVQAINIGGSVGSETTANIRQLKIVSNTNRSIKLNRQSGWCNFNYADFSNFRDLRCFYFPYCLLPESLDFLYTEVETIQIWGSKNIVMLSVPFTTRCIQCYDTPSLKSISFLGTKHVLETVEINGTSISAAWIRSTLLHVWSSVTDGKTGSLKVSQLTYDELLADGTVQKFIDKNINVTYI